MIGNLPFVPGRSRAKGTRVPHERDDKPMFSRLAVAIAGACSLALAGCATDRTYAEAPDVELTELSTLPAPRDPIATGIGAAEQLEIRVLQDPSLNGTYVTDADGFLDFPYIGTVAAAGVTSDQLAERIASRLEGRFVVDPEVVVRTTIPIDRSVSIGGEVANPGSYPIDNSETLLRGVNQAGGLTELARADDVLVMRELEGRRYIGLYNYDAVSRGNYEDPRLYPGDIVMVGDSPALRRIRAILPYISLLTSGVVLADRVSR